MCRWELVSSLSRELAMRRWCFGNASSVNASEASMSTSPMERISVTDRWRHDHIYCCLSEIYKYIHNGINTMVKQLHNLCVSLCSRYLVSGVTCQVFGSGAFGISLRGGWLPTSLLRCWFTPHHVIIFSWSAQRAV